MQNKGLKVETLLPTNRCRTLARTPLREAARLVASEAVPSSAATKDGEGGSGPGGESVSEGNRTAVCDGRSAAALVGPTGEAARGRSRLSKGASDGCHAADGGRFALTTAAAKGRRSAVGHRLRDCSPV